VDIFKIVGADGFNMISPVSGDYPISRFDGTPLKDSWEPIEMDVVESREGSEDSDCPRWFVGVLVFSRRAIESMSGCLNDEEVEILPLKTRPNEFGFEYAYSIVNVTRVIDCLDKRRSKIERYPSSGRIMHIEEYVFDIEKLEGVMVFKIPEQSMVSIFVAEPFVQLYRSTDLEGLTFKRVYSDSQRKAWWKPWGR
jgi:hypothetical protein